jgi:hypothetical protein
MSALNTIVVNGQPHRLVTPNINALARFLKRSFQVHEGGDFAMLLAPEGPACNDAFLRQWVQTQMIDLATDPLDERENLMVTLEERLLDQLSDCLPYEHQLDLDIPSQFAKSTSFPMPYLLPLGGQGPGEPAPSVVIPFPSAKPTQRRPQ